jgi:hypothetical protein
MGVLPFQGKKREKLIEEARIGYISFNHQHWRLVSPEAQEFVKRAMNRQIWDHQQ